MTILPEHIPITRESPYSIALLGATGSIGKQTLDVVRNHAGRLNVVAISVNTSYKRAAELAHEFNVKEVVIGDDSLQSEVSLDSFPLGCAVRFGAAEIDALTQLPEVDCVVNALVGQAGMRASYLTLEANKRLALANKESLVVAGDLIMPLAQPGLLVPVDSEHGAIFQCLLGEQYSEMRRIWLTASGGPFFGMRREELAEVTSADALAHPTWSMGPKITIDSATLMNKGLEVLEAMHLFNVGLDQITVVIQRQSVIHSMVEYIDGSVKAHLGVTDMRIPIQFALSYPERWEGPRESPDFVTMGHLDFYEPDIETFRCLELAYRAGKIGGTLPCVMNAANEVAVASFLRDACSLTDIDRTIAAAMDAHENARVESLEQLDEVDAWARHFASKYLDAHARPTSGNR